MPFYRLGRRWPMRDLELSEDQLRAVNSDAPALVVTAGAGSGKTEVVTRRIERILADDPDGDARVLAVSYTVRAAEELRQRLGGRLGGLHRRVDTDTIHGFALSVLRQFGTRIGLPTEPEILRRDADRVELLQSWVQESGENPITDPIKVIADLDLARARCEFTQYLDVWRHALASCGALDYAAILDRTAELLDVPSVARILRRTYGHIVVDEAQNLTCAQYRVIRALLGEDLPLNPQAVLVGDAQQSIIGFAGADPTLMTNFSEHYSAERIDLLKNFRSARSIVAVTRKIDEALGRPVRSDSAQINYATEGSVRVEATADEAAEAEFVTTWVIDLIRNGFEPPTVPHGEAVRPEEVAVLSRTASGLRSVRQRMLSNGLEVAEAGTEEEWLSSAPGKVTLELLSHLAAPDHDSVRRRLAELAGTTWPTGASAGDVLDSSPDRAVRALSVASTPDDGEDFLVCLSKIDMPAVREDKKDVEEWSRDLALLQDAWDEFIDRTGGDGRGLANFRQYIFRKQRGDLRQPGVRLLTIHKAQGQEFKAVALVGCTEGQLPDFRATSPDDRAAELRTFYVAVSRASRALIITYPRSRQTKYGPRGTQRSSFLTHIKSERSRA
jgi:DNA helicase II / ATP-dependent DNA helicase PcrA